MGGQVHTIVQGKEEKGEEKREKVQKALQGEGDSVLKSDVQLTESLDPSGIQTVCPACDKMYKRDWQQVCPDWIFCDLCNNWYHWYCLGLYKEIIPSESEPFHCLYCLERKQKSKRGRKRRNAVQIDGTGRVSGPDAPAPQMGEGVLMEEGGKSSGPSDRKECGAEGLPETLQVVCSAATGEKEDLAAQGRQDTITGEPSISSSLSLESFSPSSSFDSPSSPIRKWVKKKATPPDHGNRPTQPGGERRGDRRKVVKKKG